MYYLHTASAKLSWPKISQNALSCCVIFYFFYCMYWLDFHILASQVSNRVVRGVSRNLVPGVCFSGSRMTCAVVSWCLGIQSWSQIMDQFSSILKTRRLASSELSAIGLHSSPSYMHRFPFLIALLPIVIFSLLVFLLTFVTPLQDPLHVWSAMSRNL